MNSLNVSQLPRTGSCWLAISGTVWRNALRLSRNSASIVSAFVIPGLFVLAFWSVFGHAAKQSGMDFALFLLAAGMFQAAMFSAGGSALALAVDQESGLLMRMRAMPIPASVAIIGRLGADLIRSIASLCAVSVVALLCGAKPADTKHFVLALVLALLISEILAMFFAGITLRARHPVQTASLIQAIEMPLLMVSTAFIPVETLPDWLEPIIKHLPFSPMIDSIRALLSDTELGTTGWEAAIWLIGGGVVGIIWVLSSVRNRS